MGIEQPNAERIVLIDGDERRRASPRTSIARKGVGLVFQHSRPLQRQTVLENIKLALLARQPAASSARRPEPSTARRVRSPGGSGLVTVVERRPATLPFADLRKLELAKAIARHPRRWCWSTSLSPA